MIVEPNKMQVLFLKVLIVFFIIDILSSISILFYFQLHTSVEYIIFNTMITILNIVDWVQYLLIFIIFFFTKGTLPFRLKCILIILNIVLPIFIELPIYILYLQNNSYIGNILSILHNIIRLPMTIFAIFESLKYIRK